MEARDPEWKRDSAGFRTWALSARKRWEWKENCGGKLGKMISTSRRTLSLDSWNWKEVVLVLEMTVYRARSLVKQWNIWKKFSHMYHREKCIPLFSLTVCQEKIKTVFKIKVDRSGQSFNDFYTNFYMNFSENARRA